MRVFTIKDGEVFEGAKVSFFTLKNGEKIPAIIVGEDGRNRHFGILPVQNFPMVPCPDRNKEFWRTVCGLCSVSYNTETHRHPDEGMVFDRLRYATIGKTRSDRPKLLATNAPTTDDQIIVVFRTTIGFRGCNDHTGDIIGQACTQCGTSFPYTGATRCPKCALLTMYTQHQPFPGQILVSGKIAQGDAGRMGSGFQPVAIIPKNVVFREERNGRLYGAKPEHFFMWTGEKLLVATAEERECFDLF